MKKGLAILLLSAGLIGYGAVSGMFESSPVVASYIANDYMGAILSIDTTGTATNTAVDSVVALLSAPAARSYDATPTILCLDQSWGVADTVTFFPAGLPVNGATGIQLTFTYDGFTGSFNMYHVFSPTANDTLGYSLPLSFTHVDSTTYDFYGRGTANAFLTNKSYSIHLTPPTGDYFVGYYHPRIASNADTCKVWHGTITARRFY